LGFIVLLYVEANTSVSECIVYVHTEIKRVLELVYGGRFVYCFSGGFASRLSPLSVRWIEFQSAFSAKFLVVHI